MFHEHDNVPFDEISPNYITFFVDIFFHIVILFFMFLLVHWLNFITHILLSLITYKFNVHVQFGYVLYMV